MINHNNKFIFIHVPKVAGTSIEHVLFEPEELILSPQQPNEIEISQKVLFGQDPETKRYLQHLTAQEIKTLIPNGKKYLNDYFKFAFVRNPWDRAVSEWRWKQRIDERKFGNMLFRDFLKNVLSKHLEEDHFMPQYKYIFGPTNKCMVDFVGRFENLREDFAYVCGRINKDKKDLPHTNQTKRKRHYSEHYTSFLRDLISDVYSKDIELFDYSFSTKRTPSINKTLSPSTQSDTKRKLLFLHVPKCAGSSMYSSPLIKSCDETIHPILPSGAIAKISEKLLDKHFKFAFVRNPWDRFVSLYFYFFTMKPDHFAYQYDEPTVKRIQPYKTFKDFCLNFHEFNRGKFHFFNQSKWTHSEGKCFVDFVGKYENLQEDWSTLEKKLKIDPYKLPHKNKSSHTDYRNYYDKETIDVVAKIYKEDIENFNYDF